ncbi:hypothetical protein ASD93_11270 [Microbacterium sp. Root180]|nr:hypothetical protein ASD93_11270 [Microbacterium sp. Root180]
MGSGALTAVSWAFAAVIVFPFLWMLVQALVPNELRFSVPPVVDPRAFTLDGFVSAIGGGELFVWLRNSTVVALASTAASLVLGAGAAYAIARYRSRLVVASSVFVLASQMIPPVVLMVPLYLIVTQMGLFDSLLAVIVGNVAFTLPVVTWMLAASFKAVPIELEEAAQVDGCTRLGTLVRITIPASLPGIASAAAFAFMWGWQEFLFSRIVIQSGEQWVGGIGIASFLGVYDVPWDTIMAATFIFTLPPVIFFLFAQRGFVDSVGGSVKG